MRPAVAGQQISIIVQTVNQDHVEKRHWGPIKIPELKAK